MKIGSIRLSQCQETKIRVLPCKIDHEGETDTSGYMTDEPECSLFGRKLKGTQLAVNNEVLGLVGNGLNDIVLNGSFESISYWNWDKEVESSDQLQLLMNHVSIMKTLANS